MPIKCGKTRPADNPYETWEGHGWKWLVLKKYRNNDHAPYARALCKVFSPMCINGEMGDVYLAEIRREATLTSTNYDD